MENEDIWQYDPDQVCDVCGDQLCGGQCEKQMPQQLIAAGVAGIGLILVALTFKCFVL